MTKGPGKKATNRTRMRRKAGMPGTFKKGPAGEAIMDLVEETTDLGAPEYNVTGVARIERISPGQVRVSKYSRRSDGNFITHHEVWDYEVWQRAVAAYEQTMDIIIRMGFADGSKNHDHKNGRN